jgi:perosamine synthetase
VKADDVMMKIPVARPYLDAKEEEAAVCALRSGWISQGPRCAEFESALASTVGVRFGRVVNSGTSAIQLALMAFGVRSGQEVIVPAFTCVATLNPIEQIGARPVPVDIEPDTFALNPDLLSKAVTKDTAAVIAVHLFGLPARMDAIMPLASRLGLKTMEDAALGLGGRLHDRSVGSFGDAAVLSFHPRKMITVGEGGMVLTQSEEIARAVGVLRNYGASVQAWDRHRGRLSELPRYEAAGFNYKMSDILASIGLEQLKKLPEMLVLRRKVARRYDEGLSDLPWLGLPRIPSGMEHAYQSYVCRVGDGNVDASSALRLKLFHRLAESGIAAVQGAQSMAAVEYYRRKYGWEPRDFPVALLADASSVALPIFPGLAEDDQARVIQTIRSFHA